MEMATEEKKESKGTLDINNPPKVGYAIPLWLRDLNIESNIKAVKERIQPHYEDRIDPIAIVCYGPSLNDTWEEIKKFKYVMTCSGAHKFLIERGIVPTYQVDLDPREHKIKLLGQPHKDVEYLIASTVSPKYIEYLEGYNVKLWHIFDGSEEAQRTLPAGEWSLFGGASCGLRALSLARFLGFKNIHVFGMDGCLKYDSKITTENGIKTIKWIVDNKYSGRVLSQKPDGSFSWNKVTGHRCLSNRASKGEYFKQWVHLIGAKRLTCTEDHLCATIKDIFSPKIQYVEASNCENKYIVVNPNIDKGNPDQPLYNPEQLSVMFGILMGDGHVSKAGRFELGHGKNQLEYLQNIKHILNSGKERTQINRGGFGSTTYHLYCPINAQTKYLRQLFYPCGKKSIQNVLDHLDEISLAFWYMDDGCLVGRKSRWPHAILYTNGFTLQEHEKLKSWFDEKWGLSVSIRCTKTCRGDIQYHLAFNSKSSKLFFSLIAKYIDSSLDYKLLEDYRVINKHTFNSTRLPFSASFIKKVNYLPKGLKNTTSSLYDIEVEDNHNFVVNGVVVHNSEGKSGKHAASHPNQPKDHQLCEYNGKTFKTTASMLVCASQTPHEIDQLGDVNAVFYGEGLCQEIMKNHKKTPLKKGTPTVGFVKPELISQEYLALNKQLHKDNLLYGVSGSKYVDTVIKLAESIKAKSVGDFGAGKGLLAKGLPFPCWEYDPCVPGKEEPLRPVDLCVCFPENTIVSGSCRAIDKLSEGDLVGDSSGKEQLITHTFKRNFNGELIKLKVATVPDVEVTGEHPILVHKLRRIHRKNNISHAKSVYEYITFNSVWKKAKDVVKGDWVSVPRLKGEERFTFELSKGNSKKLQTYTVDEDLAWLLGIYVAEGFTSYGKQGGGKGTFCLGYTEEDLANKIILSLNKINIHASLNKSHLKNGSLTVDFSRKSFCKLLDSWCGKGAGNKTVPEFIKFSNESIIRSFIEGVVAGDGYCGKCKNSISFYEYFSITSISKRLVYGLLELLHKIHIHAYLPNPTTPDKRRGVIQGRNVNLKDSYQLVWSIRSWENRSNKDGKVPYGVSKFIGDNVYLPVRSSTKRKVENLPVYNIETQDHTYGVPYTVHNCTNVLEHIEPDKLDFVLADLQRCTKQVGYFVIDTKAAQKTYSNGKNAHLIIEGEKWWKKKLEKYFTVGSIQNIKSLLHVIVGPKAKEEKGVKQEITAVGDAKFFTPNTTTKWRAQTLLTKEPITIEWINSMKPGEVMYDVGANVGGYTVWAGIKKVKVYAFEPEAENYALLTRNISLNKIDAKAYCIAIGSQTKFGVLNLSQVGVGGSCHTFGEPQEKSIKQGCIGFSLDHLVSSGLTAPDHIKIDVDGLEPDVIKGALNTLKSVKSILLEINTNSFEHQEIVKHLQSAGFDYDQDQVGRSIRKEGAFKGCAEFLFKRTRANSFDNSSMPFAIEDYSNYNSALISVDAYNDLENYIYNRLCKANVVAYPTPHVFIENIFPEDIYQSILANLPDNYETIAKVRNVKGYKERLVSIPDKPFWKDLNSKLRSGNLRKMLCDKFGVVDDNFTDETLLIRDLTGYKIGPHTDSTQKVISALFYLPKDLSQLEAGTSLFAPKDKDFKCVGGPHHSFDKFDRVLTMPFRPNSLFAFLKTDTSFHGVEPYTGDKPRDVLLYDIRRSK